MSNKTPLKFYQKTDGTWQIAEMERGDQIDPIYWYTESNVGVAGGQGFGVGVYEGVLPSGLAELNGTRTISSSNYGNYQYSLDGSIMVYIPKFYYRWGLSGSTTQSLYDLYGNNAIEITPATTFTDEAEANAAGWALHRAFINAGREVDGFWIDKYEWSKHPSLSIASSLPSGNPLSSNSLHNPFSNITGSTADNIYGGAFAVAKSRGAGFFPASIFQHKALAMLSLAHSQAVRLSGSITYCEWGDITGATNYPKGNNNNALHDSNDQTVSYTNDGYLNCGKTGSGLPFAKTTHNGQSCGVADINGNMWEIAPGLTCDGINFYILKRTADMKILTGGISAGSDAWGTAGLATNYDQVSSSDFPIPFDATHPDNTYWYSRFGNDANQVFSPATTGYAHALSCAGLPKSISDSGTNLMGQDMLWHNRVNQLCPISGGYWSDGTNAGAWALHLHDVRSGSHHSVGGRSGLYP
jgi:hypothetical protein